MKLELLRRTTTEAPAPRRDLGALLSARRAAAHAEADALVAAARRDAARILSSARGEAEALRRAAHDAGFSEGERRWAEAALELAARRSAALDGVERDCIQLAVAIARQIVAAELRVAPEAIEAIAARACAALRTDAALALRVSPEDAAAAAALERRLGGSRPVEVRVDPSLGRGDCVAECAGARVDATLAVQLEAIERRLLAGERSDP